MIYSTLNVSIYTYAEVCFKEIINSAAECCHSNILITTPLHHWCWHARPCRHRRPADRSHSNESQSFSSGCRCGRCWSCTTATQTGALAKSEQINMRQCAEWQNELIFLFCLTSHQWNWFPFCSLLIEAYLMWYRVTFVYCMFSKALFERLISHLKVPC